jgi:hypothetical protein
MPWHVLFGHTANIASTATLIYLLIFAGQTDLTKTYSASCDVALFDEDAVQLLQTATKNIRRYGAVRGLQQAESTLEDDAAALRSLVAGHGNPEAVRLIEEDNRKLHEWAASQAQPIQMQQFPVLFEQQGRVQELSLWREAQELREELQRARMQRNAALTQAERTAERLSVVREEMQTLLQRASTTLPPAPASVPQSSKAQVPPAQSAVSQKCTSDILTFHCRVSIFVGVLIWVWLSLSICCFLTACGYAGCTCLKGKPLRRADASQASAFRRPNGYKLSSSESLMADHERVWTQQS